MKSDRRRFLKVAAAAAGATLMQARFGDASVAWAAPMQGTSVTAYRKLLVLVELKGGNDGLNTLVPYADPAYYALRPKLAVPRAQVIPIDDRMGLHPSLEPLFPLWKDERLAILQGVGYDRPNLSHFRSIEIWDTASDPETYLQDGWLTRAFGATPVPRDFAMDGVVIGTNDLGPLAGSGTRAIALSSTDQFMRQARLASSEGQPHNRALEHILKVEGDVMQASSHLQTRRTFATTFPQSGFGTAVRTACEVIANPAGVAVVRLSLNGFDTHGGQAATQARLLRDLADGMVALRAALTELARWDDTLVVTYAEFGRRPKENLSLGTDHGTSSVHFALGGSVRGGLYGAPPALDRLDGNGNVAYAIDFRSVYATVLRNWWNVSPSAALGAEYKPLPFLRA